MEQCAKTILLTSVPTSGNFNIYSTKYKLIFWNMKLNIQKGLEDKRRKESELMVVRILCRNN
jgi:hypothetical protein